jgi:C-terminal processing protease CtpA/Prc
MDGEGAVDVHVAVMGRKPVFGDWPRGESGTMAVSAMPPGDTYGYVRLVDMKSEPAFLRRLAAELREHGACGRLVIDLRGNGGGTRPAIGVLSEFLMPPGSAPVVYNAARGLVLPGEGAAETSRRLATRTLYPADHAAWTDAERAAVAAFAAGFKAEVEVPEGRFSAWHYAVVGKRGEEAYGGRVVVLMNERCFSAADLCLAALREIGRLRERAGLPGVTLMGQPSAGGSGLTREHRIAGGRVRVRLSTMVSYMPDGKMFDGNGVRPDVEVRPIPLNFTTHVPRAKADGTGDAMIEAALRQFASPEQP